MSLARRLLNTTARRMPPSVLHGLGRRQGLPLIGRLGAATREAMSTDGVVPHGAAAGLKFNAQGANAGFALGTSEPAVQAAFAELLAPGQVVYDIGAASGFYAVIANGRVGASGKVFAFEPFPENAQRVRHNMAINAFPAEVLQVAVGEHPGQARFALGADQNQGGLAAFHVDPDGSKAIDVEVETIDGLVASGRIQPPDVIKMDIEGAELAALRGAHATLAAHKPRLLIELHGPGGPVEALLAEHGYSCRVVEDARPVAEAEWGLHVVAR